MVFRAVLIQLAGALAAWYFVAPLAAPAVFAALQGLFACAIAIGVRQRRGMCLIHAVLLPLGVVALSAGVPPWVYLLALLVTLAFGRNAVGEQVPFYRSSQEVAPKLADLLPRGAKLLEAGAADARLALSLARLRPDVRILASESSWGSYAVAWLKWQLAGKPANVTVTRESFWTLDWSAFTAVYVFLSPAPMPRIWAKFVAESAGDALLVSNTFAIPGVGPDQSVALAGPLQKELLIWCRPYGT